MKSDNFQNLLDQSTIDFDRKVTADVNRLLKDTGITISVAESLTGGLVSGKLTHFPGSSDFFLGGVVCYTPLTKIKFCGVKPATISQKGVVSAEVAQEMAAGIRRLTGSRISVSTTGIAGPSGDGVSVVQVGTVFIGFDLNGEIRVKRFEFSGTRTQVRNQAVNAVLGYLRNWLMQQTH